MPWARISGNASRRSVSNSWRTQIIGWEKVRITRAKSLMEHTSRALLPGSQLSRKSRSISITIRTGFSMKEKLTEFERSQFVIQPWRSAVTACRRGKSPTSRTRHEKWGTPSEHRTRLRGTHLQWAHDQATLHVGARCCRV